MERSTCFAITARLFFVLISLYRLTDGKPIEKSSASPEGWRNLIGDDVYGYYNTKPRENSTKKMFEGDIVGIDLDVIQGNLTAALAQNAIVEKDRLWPDGVIPYTIARESFTPEEQSVITGALEHMMSKTCIKFIPRKFETSYITFVKSTDGCNSYVGRIYHQQKINLLPGCINHFGEVQHEVMHAMGFFHEQSRMDRDDYVDIIWDNIVPEQKEQFQKYRGNTMHLPYDYESIMHYGYKDFSVDDTNPTILPHKKASIGNRIALSSTDVRRINILYGCSTSASRWPPAPFTRRKWQPIPKQQASTGNVFKWVFVDMSSFLGMSDTSHDSEQSLASQLNNGEGVIPVAKSLCPSEAPRRLRNDDCQADQDCLDSGLGTMCCRYCADSNCIDSCR